jgi:REP element-mobilizing transposase RayT
MTYPRHSLISLQQTPYYHCIARCVRRAWLWGVDEYAGKDYSHRKHWVVGRLRTLSSIFAIEVCAYAIMSNHYHTVIYVDTQRARRWSDTEVVHRWQKLFRAPMLIERYQSAEATESEQKAAREIIELWRSRLSNVSWFMRCLNEYLARRANGEDECTGRFWEGRFKSQALLDEAGLLTAMAYVDLNPVRAGIAETPDDAQFTSIYQRIRQASRKSSWGPRLKTFRGESQSNVSLPYTQADYRDLLRFTSRALRVRDRAANHHELRQFLDRLNINYEAWIAAMQPSGNLFGRALGQLNHLQLHARALGQDWIKGLRQARRLYRAA